MNTSAQAGQAALEYILVFAALLGVCVALCFFARAAHGSATRTTTLVTCEYP